MPMHLLYVVQSQAQAALDLWHIRSPVKVRGAHGQMTPCCIQLENRPHAVRVVGDGRL